MRVSQLFSASQILRTNGNISAKDVAKLTDNFEKYIDQQVD